MAEKVRDYDKLAKDIIREVGGDNNISNAARCATRLRFVLKVTPQGAKEKIAAMPGVITVVEKGGQFQVVIGNHVSDVFEVVSQELNLEDGNRGDDNAEKQSVMNRIIATMSAVFAPFIYILAAAGILQGCLILITLAFPTFATTGTYEVLSFMSWTPFTFLPIFIAITASKHFKCNTFIAVCCCAALVNPSWTEMATRIAGGETIKFLAFNLSETTYTSSVLPPLFLVLVLSYLEKFLNKHMNATIKSLFVPFLCILIMVPITILVIGPISNGLAGILANGLNFLCENVPFIAAAVIGGFWQVIVIFGVHWGITPVVMANFANYGHDYFQVYQTCAVMAQMAAAFGVFIKTKNKAFKSVALTAGVTGIFGITEPAIYGVTLRLKKPFICGCISGAIGAVVVSFFGSMQYVYAGLPGLLTIVNAISADNPMSFIGMAIGSAVSIILAVVLVQIVGFDDPAPENESDGQDVLTDDTVDDQRVNETLASVEHHVIASPLSGQIVPLKEVPDDVFASGAMGKGVAIIPSDNKICSPVNGKIVSIFDTKHAIGMVGEDGTEILVHIGLDTVNLGGKGFDVSVKVDEYINVGDPMVTFDAQYIKEEGYNLITPIIVTNSNEMMDVLTYPGKTIEVGQPLLAVIK